MLPNDTLSESATGQIMHPGSRQLFVYWERLRAERALPNRDEIDLAALKAVLPDLVVIEKDHIRKSFRYRLAGTRACDLFRLNLTAKDAVNGWDAFEADVISKHFSLVHGQRQPMLMRMRLTTDTRQVVAAEFLGLPALVEKTGATQIVGGFFPFRAAHSLGHTAIVSRELLAIRTIWTEHTLEGAKPWTPARNFTVITGGLAAP
jgi:hypothetical protein